MSVDAFFQRDTSCLVIGAGIAGLIAARELRRQGVRVTVLEKARGVGGRMATRRYERGVFDHGTQYFAPASPWFQSRIHEWEKEGVAQQWFKAGQYEMDPRFLSTSRYRGVPAMTAIPKYLASGLDVLTSERVARLYVESDRWRVVTEAGNHYAATSCILTPPLPQTLEILASSGIPLPGEESRIKHIEYDSCIAVLAIFDHAPEFSEQGVLELNSGPVRRIMDNEKKGVSPGAHAITIHGSASFSKDMLDAPTEDAGAALLDHTLAHLNARPVHWTTHVWRYCTVLNPDTASYAVVSRQPALVLAGDAFGSNGVEGAARSGMEAAHCIRRTLAGKS